MAGEPENQRIARLTPLADVLARIDALVRPVAPRAVELAAALGRVLADDVVAAAGQPAAALALRDGWAVRAEDTADAGSYAPVPLPPTPTRIDVGEPLPPGTDAVAPLDAVVDRGGRVEALAPVAPGEGVLPAGADCRCRRSHALGAGWRLARFNLRVLAAAGMRAACRSASRACAWCASRAERRCRARCARAICSPARSNARRLRVCGASSTAISTPRSRTTAADAVVAIGGTGSGRNDAQRAHARARRPRRRCTASRISPGETAAFGFVGVAAGAAAAGPARCGARGLAHCSGGACWRGSPAADRATQPCDGRACAQGRLAAGARRSRPGAPATAAASSR